MPVHQHILSIHKERADASLKKLEELYASGEITHESDLLEAVTDAYTTLHSNLTDPLITPEPMMVKDLLRVSAVRKPLEQLDQDLTSGFSQLELLKGAVASTSNICLIERSGLDELLSIATDKVIGAKVWTDESDTSFLWASDTFKTSTKIDQSTTTARIDTKLGVATLSVEGEISLADTISNIAFDHVDATSKYVNGMAGNRLEVSSSSQPATMTEEQEPVSPSFMGQELGDSVNPAYMFDGKQDTWFEWEKYLVPSTQRLTNRGTAWVSSTATVGESKQVFGDAGVTKDYGWEYVIHWPAESSTNDVKHWVVTPINFDGASKDIPADQALTLSFQVDFSTPQDMNWLQLLPYISASSVDSIFTLTSVQVLSSITSTWVELVGPNSKAPIVLNLNIDQPIDATNAGVTVKDYQGTAVVLCDQSPIAAIRLALTQTTPYETIIGHKYYLKTTTVTANKKKLFGSKTWSWTEYTREPGNDLEGEESGTKINPSGAGAVVGGGTAAAIVGGFGVANPVIGAAALVGSVLFGTKKTVTRQDKDINTYYDLLKAYRYCIGIRELGLYKRKYSKSSTITSKPILFQRPVCGAGLIVSESIPNGWDSSVRWITYELSHDGSTWENVIPQNIEGTTQGEIHFPATNRLYFRATLSRPDDTPGQSPIIEYYAIKAIPEGSV